MHISA